MHGCRLDLTLDAQPNSASQHRISCRQHSQASSRQQRKQDPMMLVQSSKTFECVLAFAGVNNYGFST